MMKKNDLGFIATCFLVLAVAGTLSYMVLAPPDVPISKVIKRQAELIPALMVVDDYLKSPTAAPSAVVASVAVNIPTDTEIPGVPDGIPESEMTKEQHERYWDYILRGGSDENIDEYNAKYILPWNPVIDDDCSPEAKAGNGGICVPIFLNIHPLEHHDLETLLEMAEYDPEAAMLIVENNMILEMKENLRLVQLASKLSGKSYELERFSANYLEEIERIADWLDTDEGLKYVAENGVWNR